MTGVLVAIQVALATVLSLGAGLFVWTLQNLYHSPLGFAKEWLILFMVDVLQRWLLEPGPCNAIGRDGVAVWAGR